MAKGRHGLRKNYENNRKEIKHVGTKYNSNEPFRLVNTEKLFSCEKCVKRFTQQWILDRHIASTHEASYPFSCDKCDRQFKQEWNFDRHKEFKQQWNFDRHKEFH